METYESEYGEFMSIDFTNNVLNMQVELIEYETIDIDNIEELESYIYKGENGPQDFLQYRVKAKIQGYKELLGE